MFSSAFDDKWHRKVSLISDLSQGSLEYIPFLQGLLNVQLVEEAKSETI